MKEIEDYVQEEGISYDGGIADWAEVEFFHNFSFKTSFFSKQRFQNLAPSYLEN